MAESSRLRAPHAVAAIALILLVGGAAAIAQDVNVTLNGNAISLSPPPITRAGRVFVPLRGVFEKLGASVVYADGQINAQGNGHSVSLHIGSNQATVDGNGQMLDVAPFLLGASTYVPLRFVSQALGATVNYDGSNRIVALSSGQAPNGTVTPDRRSERDRPQPPQALPASDLTFRSVKPDRDSAIASRRPTIEAQFGDIQADPNSVHVTLDGLDVTNQASRSANGIVFSPGSDLQSTRHTVRVVGTDTEHRPFDRSWQFTSGVAAPPQAARPAPQPPSDLAFRSIRPERDASVPSRRPTIEAQFGDIQADPNSVHVTLDGLDVTNQTSRSTNGIVYSPRSDLQSERHTVRVTGRDTEQRPFDRSWQFTSGTVAAVNFINDLKPADDASVDGHITVSGRTLPNARVVVQVGPTGGTPVGERFGQLFGSGPRSSSVRVETNADGNGNFSADVTIDAARGQHLALVVDSTEAGTQSAAHASRTLVMR